MRGSYEGYESPISLADIMLKIVMVLFVMWLAAELQAKKKSEDSNLQKKAEFVATAEWNKERDPELDCDVDLWVRNPDGDAVYFSHKEGNGMNIERDDLGNRNDSLVTSTGETLINPEDKEYWYLRVIKPGEYSINVHLYGCKDQDMYSSRMRPRRVPVDVELIKLNPRMVLVQRKVVILEKVWDEKTAFNFTLDGTGNVSSVTDIQVKMVNSDKGGPNGL